MTEHPQYIITEDGLITACSPSFNSGSGTGDAIVLLNKFRTYKFQYDDVVERLAEIGPHLVPGVAYTPQDLCGEQWWRELSKHSQRIALLCLTHLAKLPESGLRRDAEKNSRTVRFVFVE